MKKILIGTDLEEALFKMVNIGEAWAARWNAKAEVVYVETLAPLIPFLSPTMMFPSSIEWKRDFDQRRNDEIRKDFHQLLNKVGLSERDIELVIHQTSSKVETGLQEELERSKSDFLILGGKKHGLMDRVFLGSVTEKMLQLSQVPVLVAQGKLLDEKIPRKILVAYDFSAMGEKVLEWAKEMALKFQAELYVCHVMTLTLNLRDFMEGKFRNYDLKQHTVDEILKLEEESLRQQFTQKTQNWSSSQIKMKFEIFQAVGQDIHECLQEKSDEWGADLVVMGNHSKNMFQKFFLGSVAIKMMRQGSQSFLMVK